MPATQAGVYYVSATANPTTTWAQAASSSTPCTAQRAMTNAAAGDTVYFRGGTYGSATSTVYYVPANSGTAEAQIVFSAYPGETPLIQAEFSVRNKQWLRFSGITVQGNRVPPTNWSNMPAICIDDTSVGPIDPSEAWATREAKVRRKYATYMAWYDSIFARWTSGFSFSECSHITLDHNTVSYCSSGILFNNGSSFMTSTDNELHHCYIGIFSYESNYAEVPSVTDAIIRGNHCFQNLDSGINVAYGARRVLIEDNRCEFNAIGHIGTHHLTAGVTIRGNTVSYAGYYTETMEAPGSSALNAGFGADSLVIENNSESFQLDPTGWDGNGIMVDTNEALGSIATPPVVRNNVTYRNQGSGITVTRSSRCTIIHNTCVENGYNAASPNNGAGLRLSQAESTATIAANNIFARNSCGGLWLDGAFSDQAFVNHNLYDMATGSPILARDSAHSYTSLASLYTATGREQHGVQAAPHFASAVDFHLAWPSPAIGAAYPTYAFPSDFDGVTRDATPDLGAYEYVVPVPQTYSAWRSEYFAGSDLANDAISGPAADPEGAGVTNLQRFGFGLAARGPVANPVTLGTVSSGGQTYLTLSFDRRAAAAGLSYSVESSTDLATWAPVPGLTYTAGTPASVTAQDIVTLGSPPRRFLRLRVSQP